MILGSCSSRPRRIASALLAGSVVALLALSGSCSSSTRLPPPFYFNAPGDVELVCFNDNREDEDKVVLPFACCSSSGCPEPVRAAYPNAEPVRHALITQTSRGEVAALDLARSKVLDSQRRVPGFTFVDVGGLPAAIVVPGHLPGRSEQGPQWTYVAGRQANSIRAIPTCRFLLGKECGPEQNLEGSDEVSPGEQTELQLPEAPQDMLLDPGRKALWVSLPKAGLIARVDLGEPPTDGEHAGDPLFARPFAAEPGSLAPRPPTYFVVPSGITLEPPDPEVESSSYQAVCGLGYAFEPSKPALPVAPRATSTGQALPTRMRFLPPDPRVTSDDESDPAATDTPLLLVADIGQAVLHAFAIVDGELQQRAVMPVGAPLRDFVITPSVPSQAPSFAQLVHPDVFAYAEPPPDDKRYVYAIDARDGSVMLFDLSFSGDVPALLPLQAPVPARNDLDVTRTARDRLMFVSSVARSLEVVDTRYRALEDWEQGTLEGDAPLKETSSEYRDPLYCGKQPLAQLTELRKTDKSDALEAAEAWTEAGEMPNVLRGVFVIVAASDGRVAVLDVHDLNLQCRARAACLAPATNEAGEFVEPPDPVPPAENYTESALAVRRHAPRLLSATEAAVVITPRRDFALLAGEPSEDGGLPDGDAEVPDEEADAGAAEDAGDAGEAAPPCLEGYHRPAQDSPICVVSDPWQANNRSWSVRYEGAITAVNGAVLQRQDENDRVTLWGPQGFDFCARGVNAEDDLTVAVSSQPDPDVSGCSAPSRGDEPLLYVVEAFHDHLVLAATAPDAGAPDPEPDMDGGSSEPDGGMEAPEAGEPVGEPVAIDDLMRCYPKFVSVEVRLRDQFLVTYAALYAHANRADDAGVCVANPDIDRRFSSRAAGPDWIFQDFSVAFQLQVPEQADREDVAASVQLARQSSFLAPLNVDSSSGRADALPSRIRFFSDTDDLFVVDGASQGLRRYLLAPFQADGSRIR